MLYIFQQNSDLKDTFKFAMKYLQDSESFYSLKDLSKHAIWVGMPKLHMHL